MHGIFERAPNKIARIALRIAWVQLLVDHGARLVPHINTCIIQSSHGC
jgi:hypothetical protein